MAPKDRADGLGRHTELVGDVGADLRFVECHHGQSHLIRAAYLVMSLLIHCDFGEQLEPSLVRSTSVEEILAVPTQMKRYRSAPPVAQYRLAVAS